MFNKGNKIIFSIIGLVGIVLIVFWKDVKSLTGATSDANTIKKENKGKKDKDDSGTATISDVVIVEKWDLPADLKEVSGIAYMDDQRFACIQDEIGTIFVYNSATNKIEKEIQFAGVGDFEGITLKGDIAYVIRADGKIFEIDMKIGKSSAKEYSTSLTIEHNVEGLCYDKNNNRLLLATKDNDPVNPGYKGIYAFDLSKKVFIDQPVYKINLKDEIFGTAAAQDKKSKSIMPSAMAIQPLTNDIYITDGPRSKLLVMDKSGNIKQLLQLGSAFSQPEGITFSPEGQLYISNEGTKQPGNILKVEVNRN
ncbi:MAG TPA: SdiA-regulated domain-containing protein [Chitinophagaceae bacterium]